MALELPPELGAVLGLLGLEWPQVNEDEVVRLADELRKLATTIDSVQLDADKALTVLKEAYHGASADRLAEMWGTVSTYSRLVVEACGATANALNAAALVVEGCKAATLTQLVATQGELAAASVTGPWSTAAIVAAAKQIASTILEEAVSALGQALAQPVGDLVEAVVGGLTGGGSGSSPGTGFGVDLEQLASCAQQLRRHADGVDAHGDSFRRIIEGLDVGRPGDAFGRLILAAVEQIATTVGTEVLKRLLGSFRGTADRMDQVARNLTENEDAHSREMQGILTAPTSPSGPGPLRLAGGVGGVGAGTSHHAGHSADDGPDLAAVGTAPGGGGHLPGAANPSGAVSAPGPRGARTGRSPGPFPPEQHTAPTDRAAAGPSPQPRPASAAGPHPAFGHQGGGQAPPRAGAGSAGGHPGAEPAGLGRPAVAPPAGAPDPGAHGRPGVGRHQGQAQGQGDGGPAREGSPAPQGPRGDTFSGDPAGQVDEDASGAADRGDRVSAGREAGVYGA
ncbi:hypothetical protein OG871_33950 [Kitasatospora sp. NBC_00374]|uniref:WXG100-like domain-containing protein n=1 Tax=Kitasatospora sp. NBC_00374 TaxID=2975964 RepID=UPI0030E47D28